MQVSRPTTIYLVRHGEAYNPTGIIYGRLPRFRLSAVGREQAAGTACFLGGVPLAAIYASPQLRARQTAAIIAAEHPGISVRRFSPLAEVNTAWQGCSASGLGRNFNFYEPRRCANDEGILEIFRRMERAVRIILRRHPGAHVACVSHGDPIVIATTGFAGLPLDFAHIRPAVYPRPASVTILTFAGHATNPEISFADLQHPGTAR